ncbi:MAG: sigma 54-interacting transcriptional regulator [Myxococcales bacterium]|nr:sigma 54-interacting transcriptional regulator [Myxococcales bacterium]
MRFGSWRAERLIGEGGGGQVWLARRVGGGETVVLKHTRAHDGDQIAALKREYRALLDVPCAALPTPVAWLAPGVDGAAALVMERRPGANLTDALAGCDEHRLIQVVAEGLEALRALHAAGLVHGDLHPGNMLVDSDDHVSLLDLGLAQSPGEVAAWGAGLPAFSAPERLRGEGVDPRDDLFSFGLALWRSLGLDSPWPAYPAALPQDSAAPAVPPNAPHAHLVSHIATWLRPRRVDRPVDAEAALRAWCTDTKAHIARPERLEALSDRPWRWGKWQGQPALGWPEQRRVVAIDGQEGAGRTGALRALALAAKGDVVWLEPTRLPGADPLRRVESELVRQGRLAVPGAAFGQIAAQAGALGEPGGEVAAHVDQRLARIVSALDEDGLLLIDDCDALPEVVGAAVARLLILGGRGPRIVCVGLADHSPDLPVPQIALPACTSEEVAAALHAADGGRDWDLALCDAIATEVGTDRTRIWRLAAHLLRDAAVAQSPDRVEATGVAADLPGVLGMAYDDLSDATEAELAPLCHLAVARTCAPGQDGDPMPPLFRSRPAIRKLPGGGLRISAAEARRWSELLPADALAQAAELRAKWLADRDPATALSMQVVASFHGTQPLPAASAVHKVCERLRQHAEAQRSLVLAEGWLSANTRQETPLVASDVRLAAVRAEVALGRFAAAQARIDEGATAGDDPNVQVVRAELAFRRGDYPAAISAADAALHASTLPESGPWPDLAALALLWRAFARTWQGESRIAATDVTTGVDAALGRPQLHTQFRYLAALAAYYGGQLDEARDAFISLDAGDTPLAVQAAAVAGLGLVAHRTGDLETARAAYDRSRKLAETAGDRARVVNMTMNIATIDHEAGDLGRALTGYDRVIASARQAGNAGALTRSLNNRGNLLALLGDVEDAQADLKAAYADLSAVGNHYLVGNVCCVLAELARRGGRPTEAERWIVAAETALREAGASNELREIRLERGWQHLSAGRLDDAERVATEVAAAGESLSSEELCARAAHLAGRVALARFDRDPDNGESALRDAAQHLDSAAQGLPAGKGMTTLAIEVDRALVLALRGRRGEASRVADLQLARMERVIGSLDAARGRRLRDAPDHRATRMLLRLLNGPSMTSTAELSETSRIRGRSTLSAVLALNRRLSAEHDMARLLEVLMDAAVALTGGERGFLLLDTRDAPDADHLPGPDDLDIAVARNLDHENLKKPAHKLSHSIALEVFSRGEPVLSIDAQADPRYQSHHSVHAANLRSILCVPMNLRGRTIGVLYVDNRFTSGAFSNEQAAVLEALASQAAIALNTARMIARYKTSESALARSKSEVEELNAQLQEQLESTSDALSSAREALAAERHELARRSDYDAIKGRSPQLNRLFSLMDRVRDHPFSVLIIGESGTGKELVARAIHFTGSRKDGPFVAINCGALPENLLESELFGHVRGAFTGAVAERRGLFEQSDGGTLFLDEIGEMPLAMQVKLLRVLQTGELTRVGGNRVRRVDVRVLAATHRDLDEMVREGSFREDLLYRLRVVDLMIPPLRSRVGDIPVLVEFFLRQHREAGIGDVSRITPRALRVLERYSWPGNVRELEMFLKSACIFAEGDTLDAGDVAGLLERGGQVPGGASQPTGGVLPSEGTLADLEQRIIMDRLEQMSGNKRQTAMSLGIDRGTLYNKLRAYKVM